MISGVLTLTAIEDAEFTRLHLSTDTIVVDPYNVQTEPLKIKVEQVSGVDIMPVSVYLTVQALSLNREIPGAVTDFGLCSEAEFVIPAKDKLYATVTAVRVDAWSDKEKKKLVESRTVNVTCNREAEPMYRGDKWTADMSFRNGDYLEHVVNGNTSIYQWSSRVEGNTGKAPWDITLTTDPEYGYWLHITEKTLFAAKMLLAKGALIGSAVFDGDYTISQHGVDENGQPSTRYDLFGEQTVDGKDKFTPNIVIDWMTGKFSGKNVDIEGKIKGKDADIDGRVVAKSGKIGSWKINGSKLISSNFVPPEYENWDAKGGKGSCVSSDGALMISPSSTGMFVDYSGATLAAVINAISDNLFVHGLHLRAECTDQYEGGRDARVCALEIYAGHVNSNRDHAPMAINIKQGHSRFTGTSSVPAWRGGEITITSEISTLVVNQKQITIRAHRDLEDGHDLTIINTMDDYGVEIYGDIYYDLNKRKTIHKINSRCCKTMKFLGGKFYPQSYY